SEAGLPFNITYPAFKQGAPRFGFAWRALRDTAVGRGGSGIFYDGGDKEGRVNLKMPPFNLSHTALNDPGVIHKLPLADVYLGAPLGSPNSTIGLGPEYTHLRMGNDQHWNFGIQQQVAKTMVIDAEYVGNKGTHIAGNDAFNVPEAGAGAVQGRRPFP